mmetsp:Transcript_25362/g.39783  ORF Transcript_25362/g.39783 Transcript_25362/m.39783 type:complete len:88 (+) Transcript_25362:695-958(+)
MLCALTAEAVGLARAWAGDSRHAGDWCIGPSSDATSTEGLLRRARARGWRVNDAIDGVEDAEDTEEVLGLLCNPACPELGGRLSIFN